MELEIEEETFGKVGMIITGIAIIGVILYLINTILNPTSDSSIIRSIVCGILWWIPGGQTFAVEFKCFVAP